MSDGAGSSRAASKNSSWPASATPSAVPTSTIASVTSGPATATRNSSPGVSLSRLIFITPPKKNRSMPPTSMPSRRAASACPSSCSTIEPKNRTAATTRPGKPWSVAQDRRSNESRAARRSQEQDQEPGRVDADLIPKI